MAAGVTLLHATEKQGCPFVSQDFSRLGMAIHQKEHALMGRWMLRHLNELLVWSLIKRPDSAAHASPERHVFGCSPWFIYRLRDNYSPPIMVSDLHSAPVGSWWESGISAGVSEEWLELPITHPSSTSASLIDLICGTDLWFLFTVYLGLQSCNNWALQAKRKMNGGSAACHWIKSSAAGLPTERLSITTDYKT